MKVPVLSDPFSNPPFYANSLLSRTRNHPKLGPSPLFSRTDLNPSPSPVTRISTLFRWSSDPELFVMLIKRSGGLLSRFKYGGSGIDRSQRVSDVRRITSLIRKHNHRIIIRTDPIVWHYLIFHIRTQHCISPTIDLDDKTDLTVFMNHLSAH